jgi:twitching motility protein PilT
MDAHLADLYKRKLITYEMGQSRSVDPKEFARLAGAGSPSPQTAGMRRP